MHLSLESDGKTDSEVYKTQQQQFQNGQNEEKESLRSYAGGFNPGV